MNETIISGRPPKQMDVNILSGSSGGGTDPVGLKDSGGTPINPATEDGNLATLVAKDFATQTTLAALNAKVITDSDDGTIAQAQTLPLVINLNYGREASGSWSRAKHTSGARNVVPNGGSETLADSISNIATVFTDADSNKPFTKSILYNFNGTTHDRVRGNTTDGLLVNLGSNNDVTIATLPARDRLTDNIGVAQQTDVILNDTTALTPKFVAVNLSASGDLVALVSSKRIRVIGGLLMSAGTTTVKFQSGATTDLTGALPLIANVGFQIPYAPTGNFETASGEKLNLVLSASVDVDGWLMYIEVG